MKYLSLFSGIEAATVAWKPLGWKPVAFAEIEPFPCALLAHHYPDVPNLGSVTEITSEQIAALGHIDLVVGGSPCQDLSIAGKRAGFSGERSSLFYEQMRIFHAARAFCGARWLVWENVPGAFSSQHGRDFAAVVGEMAGCKPLVPEKGWGREGVAVGSNGLLEWAVLDAQWFGVAQRRRRVFAVLDTGDWQRRPPVLFEPESVRRDHPPSREAGQEVAKSLARGTGQRLDSEGYSIHPHCIGRSPNAGPQGKEFLDDGSAYCLDSRGQAHAIAFGVGGNGDLGHCLRSEASRADKADSTTYVVQAYSFDSLSSNSMKSKNPNSGCRSVDVAKTLDTSDQNPSKNQGGMAVVVSLRGREGGATAELGDEVGNCLRASDDTLYNKGIVTLKEGNASTQETYPGTLLRALRQEIGAEAFAKWGLGILDSLQQAEVLRQALHGLSIRPASFSRSWVVCCALGFPVYGSGWLLQSLREAGCERCSSQGWEPSEQLAGQLGAYLSELSRPGAQAARFMRDLWFASEGVGLLQQALLAVQEVGRPAGRQGEPVFRNTEGVGAEAGENLLSSGVQREISCERVLQQACPTSEARDDRGTSEDEIGSGFVQMASGMMVRRLTVEECEFLQGFPRGYSKIPYRKKPADQCPDSPRYKALGNSMAVPVMRWIGERIENAATGE